METMQSEPRQCARALLLTPEQRVLLMRIDTSRRVFWITPGGGLQPGESDLDGLRRELREEIGTADVQIGPLIWTRETVIHMDADPDSPVRFYQSERFYLIQTRQFTPTADNMPAEAERDWFSGFAWMNVADIDAAEEQILPARLSTHLSELVSHGAPTVPIDVSG